MRAAVYHLGQREEEEGVEEEVEEEVAVEELHLLVVN